MTWATEKEIDQQPGMWRELAEDRGGQLARGMDWLTRRRPRRIWLSGAGTSAFIGEIVAMAIDRENIRTMATTDIVSSPDMLRRMPPDLLVNIGRSGSSSETIATLDLCDQLSPDTDWLNITCNAGSALGHRRAAGSGETCAIIMPPACNDAGFAMTSSFSTMTLAGLAVLGAAPIAETRTRLRTLADIADRILHESAAAVAGLARPSRAVFIGSGSLKAAAREAALKVLELTAGAIPTQWESSLGFRHGPKAVVDSKTLVFIMPSSDPQRRAYDLDLAEELRQQYGGGQVAVLSQTPGFRFGVTGADGWDSVLFVLWAQLLAVQWSKSLGLDVDNPFASGNLTRVVASVKIHPFAGEAALGMMAGIDVGGTKIASGLFDGSDQEIIGRRRETPRGGYDAVLAAIGEEVQWLTSHARAPFSIGIGLPGLVDSESGTALTSNLALSGHRVRADLRARLNADVVIENDCKCFAVSEARRGAGQGYRSVFGLILGTGVGGGLCIDGELVHGAQGLPGEVGHIGIPARLLRDLGLPVLACGCGREGCYETYLSGPGLERLHRHATGLDLKPRDLAAAIGRGEGDALRSMTAWCRLLAELVHTLQLTTDIEIVVIGGGLSALPGLLETARPILAARVLPGTQPPLLAIARFGPDSGVRGAALLGAEAARKKHS